MLQLNDRKAATKERPLRFLITSGTHAHWQSSNVHLSALHPPPHPVLLPLFKNALTLGGAGVRYGSHDTTEMQKDIM